MRGRIPLGNAVRGFRQLQRPCAGGYGRRAIQISSTPTTESPILTGDVLSNSIDASTDSAGMWIGGILLWGVLLMRWFFQMLDLKF